MTRIDKWESVNGFLSGKMEEYSIPGAVFTLVVDGETVFSRGYGYSSLESGLPVDPEKTAFRIYSVSGLFTAMAVLKLVDDGSMGLEDEVEKYIPDLKISRPPRKPLRVINLLNHSDGLQECFPGTLTLNQADGLTVREFIAGYTGAAVREPGESITFGNMSMAIAGLIVESVSGTSFEEFVEEMIFVPAGMERTCLSPGCADQRENTAVPYSLEGGSFIRVPDLYSNVPSADGAVTTGRDMGKLLALFPRTPSKGGDTLLSARSLEKMVAPGVSPVPGLPGVTCGFFECPLYGCRVLVRKGEGPGAAAMACVLPEFNAGFFLAMNKRDERIMDLLAVAVIEELGNSGTFNRGGGSVDVVDPEQYCGEYHYIQRNRNSIAKYMSLSKGLLRVEYDENDKDCLKIIPLGLGDSLGDFRESTRWRPLEEDLFECDKGSLVAFKRDSEGKPFELCSGRGFHGCYERTGWHESAGCNSALAGLFLMFFLMAALASPAIIFGSREPAGLPFVLLGITALLNFLFLVSIQSVVLNRGAIDGTPSLCFFDNPDPVLKVVLAVPLVTAAFTFALIVFSVIAWSMSYQPLSRKILFTLFAVLSFAFTLFLNRLKLLGYRY
ncbi:MAG: beta-lactamase family protein [Actinobacteria bacterium]|nr:beta-lactamase family protein [Actinomycetota bacterium]